MKEQIVVPAVSGRSGGTAEIQELPGAAEPAMGAEALLEGLVELWWGCWYKQPCAEELPPVPLQERASKG